MKKIIHWVRTNLPDEMDKTVRLKSIQWTWLYSVVFLMVWIFYEAHQARQNNTRMNTIPNLLLLTQLFVLTVSQLIYRFRLTKGEDEERETVRKKNKIVITVIIALVLIFAGAATYAMLSVAL